MPKANETMSASQKRKIAKSVSTYHKSACRGMSEYVRKKPNEAKGGGKIERIKAGAVKSKALKEGKTKRIKEGLKKAVRVVKKRQQVKKTAEALKSVMTSTTRKKIIKKEMGRDKQGKKVAFQLLGGNGNNLTAEDKKALPKRIDKKWKEMLRKNPSYYSLNKTTRKKLRKQFFGVKSVLGQKYKKLRIQRQSQRIKGAS